MILKCGPCPHDGTRGSDRGTEVSPAKELFWGDKQNLSEYAIIFRHTEAVQLWLKRPEPRRMTSVKNLSCCHGASTGEKLAYNTLVGQRAGHSDAHLHSQNNESEAWTKSLGIHSKTLVSKPQKHE